MGRPLSQSHNIGAVAVKREIPNLGEKECPNLAQKFKSPRKIHMVN